jgi:hypothetical protein
MKRALIVAGILILFLIANRGAFEGYFSDDDLDNLSWATVAGIDSFAKELLTPVFSITNTRPTGGLYYRWAGGAFGWKFEYFLVPLFLLHWLNCGLLYWIARRKGAGEFASLAAALFFLFHSGLLEAWWKPMYIFDLLAATFCLVTWLLFGTKHWLLALVSFWLAYKSKEVALFFPVVLAFDHWRRAIPFVLISASFGLQAMQVNAQRDSVYTLRFTPASVLVTIPFYLKQAVLNKFGAVVLAPLALLARERSLQIAVLGMAALLVPLLFLPGRLFGVYLYVPLIALMPGLALACSSVPKRWLATGLILFLALDYRALREKRNTELAAGHETRAYVEQLRAAHEKSPLPPVAYFENAPLGFRLHGMTGALRLITGNPGARVLNPELESARLEAKDRELPTISWFRPKQQLSIIPHRYGEAKRSELKFIDADAGWQLTQGWFDREGNFRWAVRTAKLMLLAEPEQSKLRIQFNNGPLLMKAVRKLEVSLYLNGELVGKSTFLEPGTPTVEYPLPKRLTGPVEVELRSSPGFKPEGDDRELGIAVLSIGLVR